MQSAVPTIGLFETPRGAQGRLSLPMPELALFDEVQDAVGVEGAPKSIAQILEPELAGPGLDRRDEPVRLPPLQEGFPPFGGAEGSPGDGAPSRTTAQSTATPSG